jgi:hypothetical protein
MRLLASWFAVPEPDRSCPEFSPPILEALEVM